MNPVAALVLAEARSHLGEMESPPHSNYHPTVRWYNEHVFNLGTHWNYCAAGVTRAFYETPAKDLFLGRAYVPWMMQDFVDGVHGGRLIWVDNDADLEQAQPGDVVFFDWEATKRHSVWVGDHVGIVESDGATGEVITIEQNTSVPGTGNEGVARKVRDTKYVAALGRPNWSRIAPPTIPGTDLPLLQVDGAAGAKTFVALSTIYRAKGYPVKVSGSPSAALTKAIQADLNKAKRRDASGRALVVDGKGFGSNSGARYPRTGWTRTIQACQIGHGVRRSKADGVFDADNSSEVKRIQRDINRGGTKDSPVYTG